MAESRITSVPPKNLNGISRPGRGAVVVKPKNLKGTLKRLWDLTKGHRKGLGWVLLLSAFSSAAFFSVSRSRDFMKFDKAVTCSL